MQESILSQLIATPSSPHHTYHKLALTVFCGPHYPYDASYQELVIADKYTFLRFVFEARIR